jgi:hypothetical protein
MHLRYLEIVALAVANSRMKYAGGTRKSGNSSPFSYSRWDQDTYLKWTFKSCMRGEVKFCKYLTWQFDESTIVYLPNAGQNIHVCPPYSRFRDSLLWKYSIRAGAWDLRPADNSPYPHGNETAFEAVYEPYEWEYQITWHCGGIHVHNRFWGPECADYWLDFIPAWKKVRNTPRNKVSTWIGCLNQHQGRVSHIYDANDAAPKLTENFNQLPHLLSSPPP